MSSSNESLEGTDFMRCLDDIQTFVRLFSFPFFSLVHSTHGRQLSSLNPVTTKSSLTMITIAHHSNNIYVHSHSKDIKARHFSNQIDVAQITHRLVTESFQFSWRPYPSKGIPHRHSRVLSVRSLKKIWPSASTHGFEITGWW